LLKALAYGAAIPIVSAQRGLTTFGGSEGVGSATTNAVVHSSLAIIVLDLILSVFGYAVFPPS
jgi:phospholipid/cholesterol/gamma-HCH transport system permease protein